MPYKFKRRPGGGVVAVKKDTGKVAFHSSSMAKAKEAAKDREMFKNMK